MNYIFHRFTPTNVSASSGDVQFDLGEIKRYYAHDLALYVNDDWEIDIEWSRRAVISESRDGWIKRIKA